MGLGKTIQVLSLMLVLKSEAGNKRKPCLLVAPASLLANWVAEIARFAPSLRAAVVHPSAAPTGNLKPEGAWDLTDIDLVITSYGFLARAPWLVTTPWRLAVLDEAQAIKNPAAKQTKTVKQLRAEIRIVLTGTPIENRLGDLWSIFDFINPGLLGSAKQFSTFVRRLADRPHNPYGPLRDLVRPYILRRLKTDRDHERRSRGDGRRVCAVQDQDRDRARRGQALASHLPGLCRNRRFVGRIAAGPLGEAHHGQSLSGERRLVSVARGNRTVVQLSGLGRHVQTCCGGALWRRCPA
jgi:SNF2 family DNA or RNA helicase